MLTHLSLFTGIGGIDLAGEWVGFETIGQCEWADYPTKVLEKHWPTVPRWRDIRELTYQSFIDKTGRSGVDLISGGFPCQPFSVAGKQKGKDDDRYLWPEMLRVISELRPSWVVGENVTGIINMELEQVCTDLEALGYGVQTYNIPACAVDAPHQRKRVFIVGYSEHNGSSGTKIERSVIEASNDIEEGENQTSQFKRTGGRRSLQDVADTSGEGTDRHTIRTEQTHTLSGISGQDVADTDSTGLGKRCRTAPICTEHTAIECSSSWGEKAEWLPEPSVGRVANGIPRRVDRLKCLGNAVVPQQVYPILKAIATIEGV